MAWGHYGQPKQNIKVLNFNMKDIVQAVLTKNQTFAIFVLYFNTKYR